MNLIAPKPSTIVSTTYNLPPLELAAKLTGMDYRQHPSKQPNSRLIPLTVFSQKPDTTSYDRDLTPKLKNWLQTCLELAMKQKKVFPGDTLPSTEKLADFLQPGNPVKETHRGPLDKACLDLAETGMLIPKKSNGMVVNNPDQYPIAQGFGKIHWIVAEITELLGSKRGPKANAVLPVNTMVKLLQNQLMAKQIKHTSEPSPPWKTPWSTDHTSSLPSDNALKALIGKSMGILQREGLVKPTGKSGQGGSSWERTSKKVYPNEAVWQGHTRPVDSFVSQTLENMYTQWPKGLALPSMRQFAALTPYNAHNKVQRVFRQHVDAGLITTPDKKTSNRSLYYVKP